MTKATARALAQKKPTMSRQVLGLSIGLAMAAMLGVGLAKAESHDPITKSHGYSYFGEYKYDADFAHLDYVNPDAPKGGEISTWAPGTFDSFNAYSRKGRAAALSTIGYESLLTGTSDDVKASYGLLAHTVEYPASQDWVIFHMRPEARFSDGTPVTAHDVVFSHNLFLEQGLPSYAEAVSKLVTNAEALDDHTVKFTFAPDVPRRSLISQVGGTPVFPKAWYEKTGARLDESRLEITPGSGPYVLESYDINRQIVYKRNPDYWGKDLPINRGRANFDRIRVEYFADSNAAFEGFKAGAYTFRQENNSLQWATAYNFPSLEKGHVVQNSLPNGNIPRASGFVFNLAKPQFQDVRVRKAVALAYNFTWTNETLQYGLFSQRVSFWQNSDNAATDLPEGLELEVLESVRNLIDPAVFTDPAVMPHTSGQAQLDRRNIRAAGRLLDEAGWAVSDEDGMRRKDGQLLQIEILERSPTFDRIVLPYVENLKKLGIAVTYNRVDPAQYTNRARAREYDMIFDSYTMHELPSTGLEQQFGSETAEFSVFNPSGYSSEAVDKIIDYIVDAKSTDQVQAGARALDRILRRECFMIPVWYLGEYWVAYYDMYEHPETLPPYALGEMDFWWYNADKAAALKAAGAL
ncbi:MAG: extracellular solute-binding protein [Planktomarina sp.]